ncbi:F-box protein [Acorus calamus]|uniref:F-box protein n=1 Tax=Acorus calamus TaxID=4465 RepID=A0AAV9FEB0_ACOCL|nr:F-box protein [Acorus calamus]
MTTETTSVTPGGGGVSGFYDPEEIQLCILSFLSPSDIAAFAATSKRSLSFCRSDASCASAGLWSCMCHRRWGYLTQIPRWGGGRVSYRSLYRTLDRWENLIGFWRRIGRGLPSASPPPLVFFEWGSSFLIGSRVSPSLTGYGVLKVPFIWMGFSLSGEPVSYLDPERRFDLSSGEFVEAIDSDLVPVSVGFVGGNHFVVEERGFGRKSSSSDEEGSVVGSSSPPDCLMSDVYQYFANRTSTGRRQRRREKQGRRKLDPEHFMKVANCYPTPDRPLQGLWKGICDDMRLEFYLVTYDDIGGITCRRVGESVEPFSGYCPVFWTSNTTFIEPPFSIEEENIYQTREHIQPLDPSCIIGSSLYERIVARILHINSSYDLVIPDLSGTATDPRNVEGRIWQYKDGTFGFGFLRNNDIVDLKHIVLDGCLLDTV